MPFIVQCPYPECRKYMLLEDAARGATVECLLCRKPLRAEAAAGVPGMEVQAPTRGPAPTVAKAPPPHVSRVAPAPAQAPTAPSNVRNCPNCATALRLPPAGTAAVKCGKCGHIFKP